MLKYLLNLQLFADGDGGDGGASSEGEGSGVMSAQDKELASIPERAKKFYPKAKQTEAHGSSESDKDTPSNEPSKPSYMDLIKSDDYKQAHKEYMEKTLNDRLKKYKNVESTNEKMLGVLQNVALKYGLDANSETFLEDVAKAVDDDESYFEQYAIEHDMTPQDARKVVTLERKVAEAEEQRKAAEQQRMMDEQVALLRSNAEKTKAQFPQFDLEAEMQDERFRRLCAVNNGDTTAAYMACHWQEVMNHAVASASKQAQVQTANAIASTGNRPLENGINGAQATITTPDFSHMDLKQLRAYADEQRRKQRH